MHPILRLVVVVFATPFLLAQPSGSVRGTVVDQTGNRVQGATFFAQPQGMLAMVIPQCTTDESGSCSIPKLDFGRYFVYAGKPDDGYPDSSLSFFLPRGAHPMEAIVSEDHPRDDVVVHLGIRAGILKGTVTDAVTGKPLNANVEFRWVSDPDNFLSGSGLTNATFRVLIPSDTALTMVVSLDGYEKWIYGVDGGQRGKPVLLHPGQDEILTIKLRPRN